MAEVLTMEAANLICGDLGAEVAPGSSTHLQLAELKLPGFEENYVDFLPGGTMVGIEIPTHFNRLEGAFNLNGWQPEVMGILAQSDVNMQRFTAYGLIRNRRTGEANQAVGVMEGRMGRVNPTAYRKGDLQMFEFSIRSIVFYHLMMQENVDAQLQTIYRWDFFSGEFSVRGPDGILRDMNADYIRALAIPTTQAPTE